LSFAYNIGNERTTDILVRLLQKPASELLNQQVVIENRAGGGSVIGTNAVAQSAPDGYTVLGTDLAILVNHSLMPKLPYDTLKDFRGVTMLARAPLMLLIHPSVPANTIEEFVILLKQNPGKYNFASAGSGTVHHLAGELFKIQTGTFIVHIPYRGAGPAMSDLLAGQVDLEFDGLGTSAPQINSVKLFAIAVAADKRNPAIPNVPTFAEAGLPDYKVSTWYAMFAPAGTPKPIIDKMTAEVQKALNNPKLKAIWASNGAETPNLYGPAFGQLVAADVKRWAEVVQKSGAKLD
jgi:tripartite-type tricarboxylate transporter receptor subunit TctC